VPRLQRAHKFAAMTLPHASPGCMYCQMGFFVVVGLQIRTPRSDGWQAHRHALHQQECDCWEQSKLGVVYMNASSLLVLFKGCYNRAFKGNRL